MNAAIPTSSYKHQAKSAAGFTLIELMVTIAVLAIIVSIAAPNISTQLANQRVKATAATIESALKEAKAESVIRRQNLTVKYDDSGSSKEIKIEDTSSTPLLISSYKYNAKSSIKTAPTTITFSPSKVVNAAATYIVCDSNTAVSPRQVSVSKLANISNKPGGTC